MTPSSTVLLVEVACNEMPNGAQAAENGCQAVHKRIMSPDVDLSQLDLQSLDGLPSSASGHEVVGELFEKIAPLQPSQ